MGPHHCRKLTAGPRLYNFVLIHSSATKRRQMVKPGRKSPKMKITALVRKMSPHILAGLFSSIPFRKSFYENEHFKAHKWLHHTRIISRPSGWIQAFRAGKFKIYRCILKSSSSHTCFLVNSVNQKKSFFHWQSGKVHGAFAYFPISFLSLNFFRFLRGFFVTITKLFCLLIPEKIIKCLESVKKFKIPATFFGKTCHTY